MATPQLAVILAGRHVADVERTRAGVLRLAFSEPIPIPLSLSLPSEEGTHTGARVESWLNALLPDNDEARTAIARLYGADRDDPLSLLATIGKDCAGAVQLCLPDEIDATIHRTGDLEPAPDHLVEQRLSEMAIDQRASWTMRGEHWSLGGTQQKFTLRRRPDGWFFPHGSEPTTHIVKPGIRDLYAQALVEHVTMAAARRLGLPAAETAFAEFGSEDALVVTRFDRDTRDGHVARIHQENMCQALGNPEKYEDRGGPSAAEVVRLLREQSTTARQARVNVQAFVELLVFNTVAGAPDAHGRNYAVLLDERGPRVAPLYDAASGLAYGIGPGDSRVVSMSIGGTFELAGIDADAWRRFADQVELNEQPILDLVRAHADQLPAAVEESLAEVGDLAYADALRERLIPTMRAHCAELSQRLG